MLGITVPFSFCRCWKQPLQRHLRYPKAKAEAAVRAAAFTARPRQQRVPNGLIGGRGMFEGKVAWNCLGESTQCNDFLPVAHTLEWMEKGVGEK